MGFPGLSPKRQRSAEEVMQERVLQQQAQQAQMEVASNPQDDMVAYQHQAERADLMRWQQELDDQAENLKHRLRSEYKTEDGDWLPKKTTTFAKDSKGKIRRDPLTKKPVMITIRVPPLTNDLFIEYIESQVEPFLSRNLLNSNFNEARILGILKNTMDDIVNNMADGWDVYEIEFRNYDIVTRLIKNTIIPGPFRALNDGERRHQRTINKRVEAFTESGKVPRQRGLVTSIFDNK